MPHVALAGMSATGWLLLSVSCVRLEPQLISAFTCERGGVGDEREIRLRCEIGAEVLDFALLQR